MEFSRVLVPVGMLAASATGAIINGGGGTGNWNTAANRSGGVLPITGDAAVIASGTLSINATLSPALVLGGIGLRLVYGVRKRLAWPVR